MGLLDWLSPITDIAGLFAGDSAAKRANRTNIKLSREQRAWEENMANTAVQRRKADIEKAGFNPLLAAVGPGAGTPSVSAPTVEPTIRAADAKGIGANALQAANIRANTALQAAQARKALVEANNAEKYGPKLAEWDANVKFEASEQADLRSKIIANMETSTAAEAKRARETADALIDIVKQQRDAGKLDLDALENVAKVGGLEAGKLNSTIKLIADFLRTLSQD